METFWFFRLRFRQAYDSAYDSNFCFSLDHKHCYDSAYDSAYDSDSDSVTSENQPLGNSLRAAKVKLLSLNNLQGSTSLGY